ncbi:MAG: single-stranded DNA-binding protein, partial [Flavobacterium sp.]
MKVKLFNIGLNPENLIADQEQLNDFLEGIKFVKSDTHFVESEANYWSVMIHYEEKVETKTAEIIERFVTKGKEVAIEGKLTHRSYDDKNGEKRYITEVVVNDLLLLG